MPVLDIFDTRTQLKAVELMPPVYTFFADIFGKNEGTVEDDKAIFDYMKGTERMAPVVHEGVGGVLMDRDGFQTREIGFCTVAPKRIISLADINKRGFGEGVLGAMTSEERAKKKSAKDLTDMRAAVQRRRDWMIRQLVLNGKLAVFKYTNEGRDLETTQIADFGFTQHFTPETAWSGVGAKIDYDMQKLLDLVQEGSGDVNVIVMAPDVASAMLENSTYIKKFELVNAEMGKAMSKYQGQGVRYLGMNVDGVDMFSFTGKFTDDDGVRKYTVPTGTLIAGSRQMIKLLHGPVTQVEDPGPNAMPKTYIKPEVPLRYGSIEANSVALRLTSCPTVMPYNVDGWAVAHVL